MAHDVLPHPKERVSRALRPVMGDYVCHAPIAMYPRMRKLASSNAISAGNESAGRADSRHGEGVRAGLPSCGADTRVERDDEGGGVRIVSFSEWGVERHRYVCVCVLCGWWVWVVGKCMCTRLASGVSILSLPVCKSS